MAQSVKQPLSCQVYTVPTLKNLIQFVFGDPFLPKGTKLKFIVSEGHTFQMQIHVWDSAVTLWPWELQFFQKGN